ncbi:hypothetical protein [Roseimaritima ulvae]|uniref:Uncharacterized protein n=1 Tax=Roseimaritima ulvae TaxID=980254 RepID=A0A5B9QQX5_9BACT|nr:hypothetical protein [Roseimaritima ulvae]QEG39436.1 hypothetical protein UC8_14310 [Roseimaritima ulvae]
MTPTIAFSLLYAMGLLTFSIELWTGIAVKGWSGDQALVHRDRHPGPYWFVMALQMVVLFGIPAYQIWG